MRKSRLTRVFWICFLSSAVISVGAFYVYSARLRQAPSSAAPPQTVAPKTITPEMRMQALAAQQGRGAAAPTPEQIEEEMRVDREQVATATAWLQDANAEQRIAGAEQLSAYPTPEAEEHLITALRDDLAPEVRATAAQSLDFFEELQDKSMQALLAALEDADEDVRLNALGTLQNHYQKLESESGKAKKILSGLKKKSKSARVPLDTQKAIQDFLRDQR